MNDLGFDGFAVREFLDLDWKFKSHHGNMPVAAERRYFARDGIVECWHPYWPPSSITMPSDENWQQLLSDLQATNPGEVDLLSSHASKISKKIGGYWSIDFCRHRNGTWYITDMAVGNVSYHWPTCPRAPPSMLEQYGDPEKIVDVDPELKRMLEE
jgi:hypothetical protein